MWNALAKLYWPLASSVKYKAQPTINASKGGTASVRIKLPRLRSFDMNARRQSVRKRVHSSLHRTGSRRRVGGKCSCEGEVAVAGAPPALFRTVICLTSWKRRKLSYLSRQ